LSAWRSILARSGFQSGCAVVAVTVATDSPELLEHAASEGAVILGRGEQSMEPFDFVAAQLRQQVRQLGRKG
jgi:TetR/AcrR family transcriptional repressor of lmrAB and yxaGH operons